MSPILSRPPRAPRSSPVNPGAQAPGSGKGTTASEKLTGAPRATRPDKARQTKARPRGTPERHAAGQNQGTRTGAKQQRPPRSANPGSAHNPQRTTAQEQVPGNIQPTRHTPKRGMAGYKQMEHTDTHTPTPQPGVAGRSRNSSPSTHKDAARPSQERRGTRGACTQTHLHPNTPARERCPGLVPY